MPDWTESMQRTYEFYLVDSGTWQDIKKLSTVISSSVDWDSESDTLGSATIDVTESLGETYVRIYMITNQNGVEEKRPLGTFLVQTSPLSFDGKIKDISLDAYTPLLELNEKNPPIGYFVPKDANIMDEVYNIVKTNMRAPVVKPSCGETLNSNFVADTDDTWLTFVIDLMAKAKYKFDINEMGRVLFMPKQDIAALQPIWTYDDGNSSILYPDIKEDNDLYGIPNTVEVICSGSDGTVFQVVAVNNDPDSPTSKIARGREIKHRDTNPSISGTITRDRVEEYAKTLLKELSSLERTISYTHGYCPVRIGDCIRLNYERADLINIKARVISQSINCTTECDVSETAVYTTKLCRGEYIDIIK